MSTSTTAPRAEPHYSWEGLKVNLLTQTQAAAERETYKFLSVYLF